MRCFTIALASLCMLLVVSQRTKAGMIYDLQNYPADQNGHTLSGTITTDGTIGTLQLSNIKSWNVTIDATDKFSSQDFPANTYFAGTGLIATPTELTLATPTSGQNSLYLSSSPGGRFSDVFWRRLPGAGHDSYSAEYHAPDLSTYLWSTSPPQMGGTDPWVLAEAQTTAVPEPAALVLAGSAIVCGLAYGLARKRRAQRKARNE